MQLTLAVDYFCKYIHLRPSQPAVTCSKVTIETLEEGVKYVKS